MQPASSAAALTAAQVRGVVPVRRIPRCPPKAPSSLPYRILREYTWLSDLAATVLQHGAPVTQITDFGAQNRNLYILWNRSSGGHGCGLRRNAMTKAKRPCVTAPGIRS